MPTTPVFYLGYTEDMPLRDYFICKVYPLKHNFDSGVVTVPLIVNYSYYGDWRFAKGISKSDRNTMLRLNMFKQAGYRIRRKHGLYISLHTMHDVFPAAAFYKCKHIKSVILPRTCALGTYVQDFAPSVEMKQQSEEKGR